MTNHPVVSISDCLLWEARVSSSLLDGKMLCSKVNIDKMANLSVCPFPDIKAAAEHLLVMRGEGADQLPDEVVALLRLEAEHQVGAGPVT